MLEVGKLYICEEYFLMLYPDPETAVDADALTAATEAAATAAVEKLASFSACASNAHAAAGAAAAYWSNLLGKPVFYTEKNIPLLVLNDKEEYIEVLAGDKKGWIIYDKFLNIKEIDYA